MKLIEFKYPELETEFERLDFRLQIQTYALAGFMFHKFGKGLLIVSIYRDGDMTSVHYWLCGLDFRISPNDEEPIYTDDELIAMRKFTGHFEYDKNRPRKKALWIHQNRHKPDKKRGKHGHFQVFPSSDTTRIKK